MNNGTVSKTKIEYPRKELSGISRLIFWDRYALKDPNKKFEPGDPVVAVVDNSNPKYPRREACRVIEVTPDGVRVETLETNEEFLVPLDLTDRPLETSPSEMWDRMAKAIVQVEPEEKRDELEEEFRWMLEDFRFSPGGRINAMLGTGQELTAYNCFVIPIENAEGKDPDSRQAIIHTLGNQVEIMSRGGGVGINLSALRPTAAYVKGVNGRSSGAVSWGNLNSFVTNLVEQGGSRRGALLLMLEDWHPDLLQFIYSKNKEVDIPAINAKLKERFGANFQVKAMGIDYANISVGISNAFMHAVKHDLDWTLEFPDTTAVDKEVYANEWDGNLRRWKAKGYPTKVYATLPARKIWECIIESAWASAEPGVIFIERVNEESNSWYFEDLVCTNPCGN